MNTAPDDVKVGRVVPGTHHGEIRYETPEGTEERITGIVEDPDDPSRLRATRYSYNEATKETTVERGHILGTVTEAGNFVWEHKKEAASTVVSIVVSVVVGTLWVRHRQKG